MKMAGHSFIKKLKVELLQLIGVMTLSAFILTLSLFYMGNIDEQMLRVLAKQGQLNGDIDRLMEDEAILNEIGDSFSALKVKGFYGEEDRLAWTEVLKQLSEELTLPNFKYSIAPQREVSNIGSGFQSRLGLSESMMSIEADLLHEGDFVTIAQQLSDFAPGVFRVKECKMTKGDVISFHQIKRNVGISCSLAWYTVKPFVSREVNK
ncbi:MAG: hypothetical protein AB1Y26_00190 [Cycloclasticus sp.]